MDHHCTTKAHRAVIFAIVQLSCSPGLVLLLRCPPRRDGSRHYLLSITWMRSDAVSVIPTYRPICRRADIYLFCYLRRRRRLCFWFGLFVCLFVCLSVGLLANLWTDYDEIFLRGRAWIKDQVIQFWWRSGSRFGSGSPKSEIRILRIGGGLCSLSTSSLAVLRVRLCTIYKRCIDRPQITLKQFAPTPCLQSYRPAIWCCRCRLQTSLLSTPMLGECQD